MTCLTDGDRQSPSNSALDPVTNECHELQESEMEVLFAIYTSNMVVHHPPHLDLNLPRSIIATIQIDLYSLSELKCWHPALSAGVDPVQPRKPAVQQPEFLQLRFLPTFTLTATLPPTYPLRLPPSFQLDCDWATPADHQRAMESLPKFWRYGVPETDTVTDGDQCISLCVDWLEHDWIHPSHPPDLVLQYSTPEQQSQVTDRFIDHDRKMRTESFNNEYFECGICLESQKGHRCLRLSSCGHVFCQGCLKDFFSLMIREGSVEQVACCDQSCVKPRPQDHANASLASPGSVNDDELESLVGPTLKERYDRLVEKRLIESNPMLCNCPMEFCRALVRPDPTLDATKSEDLRVCDNCGFAFCFLCKRTWHGSTNQCAANPIKVILKVFVSATHQEKLNMVTRLGLKHLECMIKEYIHDLANKQWKMRRTRPCAQCNVPIEKNEGCDHIHCTNCNIHFCFSCGVILKPHSIYSHWKQPGAPCFTAIEVDQDQIEPSEVQDANEPSETDLHKAELFLRELVLNPKS